MPSASASKVTVALSVSTSASALALRHLLAVLLEPADDRPLLHRVRQAGHDDLGHGGPQRTGAMPARSRTAEAIASAPGMNASSSVGL